ncbi:MAG: serine hydrolase domain-containing protein [Armatimonas sp.]
MPLSRKTLLALLLGDFLTSISHAAEPEERQVAAKMDAYLKVLVHEERFSGSVLVTRIGKPILNKGYGMASYELGVPNTPKTVFRIASLTKAFTAAAIIKLQEQGKLRIDEPISKYLDNCPASWEPIRIRHLLTQTSGIPNYTNFPGYKEASAIPITDEALVARFRDKPLDFAPGTKYNYSNSGYHLLGMIIARASGKPYADFLQEAIFAPLGMKNTIVDRGKSILPNQATGYAQEGSELIHSDLQDMAQIQAEGGISSTTGDMALWDQALYTEKLLSKQSLEEIFTPFRDTYGYGWNITRLFDHREIKHTGRNFGFTSHIKRFPDDKVMVLVLSNNQMQDAEKITADLAAILFGAPYRMPRIAKTVSSADQVRFVGKYAESPTNVFTVVQEQGKLFIQNGNGKSQLFSFAPLKFFLKDNAIDIEFLKDHKGEISGLILLRNGRKTTEAKRLSTL